MKNIFFLLLFICSVSFGQKSHDARGPIWMFYTTSTGVVDSVKVSFDGNTVKFITTKDKFDFIQKIKAPLAEIDTIKGQYDELFISSENVVVGNGTLWLNDVRTAGFHYDLGELYITDPSINSGNSIPMNSFALKSDTANLLATKSDLDNIVITGGEPLYIADSAAIKQKTRLLKTTGTGTKYLSDNGIYNTVIGGSSLTAIQIKDSLETLTGTARLDTSAIKGIEGMQAQINSLSKLQTATIYFLENAASDIGGYEQLVTSPLTLAGVTEVVNINNNAVLFDAYATNIGFPNIDTIPAGLWILHAHVDFSAVTGNNYVIFDVLKRSMLGVETRLFRDSTADISATGIIEHELTVVKSAFSFTPNDRLIIKLYARTTGGAKTATLYYSGTTNYAFIEPPFLQGTGSAEMVYPSAGLAKSTGTGWSASITDNSPDWDNSRLYPNYAAAPSNRFYIENKLAVKGRFKVNYNNTDSIIFGQTTSFYNGGISKIYLDPVTPRVVVQGGSASSSLGLYYLSVIEGNMSATYGSENMSLVTTGQRNIQTPYSVVLESETDSMNLFNSGLTFKDGVNTVTYTKDGYIIRNGTDTLNGSGGGTTDLTPINERIDSIVAALADTISADSLFHNTVLTGIPKAPTATIKSDSTHVANKDYVDNTIGNITTISENSTLNLNKIILTDATTGNITLTLPSASTSNIRYTIKKIDSSTNTVTIQPVSAQTIDGEVSLVILDQYGGYSIISNGSNWFIINIL